MKPIALVMLAILGCGSKEKEPEPPPEKTWSDRAKSMGEELGSELTNKAKDLGVDIKDKATAVGSEVVEKAMDVAVKASELSGDAVKAGKDLKDELRGKLALAKLDYDLAVDVASESEDDHQSRLAGMKQLKVGDYQVGYARDAKHPLGGVYKWQFRITWWVPAVKRAVRLSMFTNHELPDLDLVAALVTIVPLAEKLVIK